MVYFDISLFILLYDLLSFLFVLFQLLDDNRELFIAETQETVKAHANFMLFATQNPPGQYGGRKVWIFTLTK